MSVSSSAPPKQNLPQGVRTLISFLLFVHLFLLSIAIAANFPPLSAVRESLGARLRDKGLLAHLQVLDMDRAYDTRLTHGRRIDIDHQIQGEVFSANGKPVNVNVPPSDGLYALRAQRYFALGRSMAMAEALGGEQAGLLPAAVARGLLLETGADRLHLLCRGHFLLSREESVQGMDPNAPQKWVTVYEADAELADGDLIFQQRAAPLETAPPATSTPR
jgi:hypothetical protein